MNAKKNLLNAIEKLVSNKPLEKVSVQEILDEAEVSRRTFYKYYSDKYDLANSFYKQHVSQYILSQFDGHNWADILTAILLFIRDHLQFYQKLQSFRGQGSFHSFLMQYSFDFYCSVYRHNHQLTELNPSEEYDIWFATGGNIYLLEKWIEDNCPLSVADFVANLMGHTPRDYCEYQA